MSEDRLEWRAERVKEYFEIFCMEGEKCGFTQENEGKRGGFRRWQDGRIRFLAGFLASPYGVGNENAEGRVAKSV